MPYEQSAGAVIYYKTGDTIEYLLMQYRHLKWDVPRGHVESGETLEEAAKREINEEVGEMPLRFIPGFKEKASWFYKKKNEPKANFKEVIHFLAESTDKRVVLSDEDLEYRWLTLDAALALPMFPHVVKVLTKANDFLRQMYEKG
jgi:8-oxo-dGTP pyrophosphatase MutT (NUDIX family)